MYAKRFIVWTGRMDTLGTLWPSSSIGSTVTIEEAVEKGRDWQEMAHRQEPTRKAGHCVITTYGEQRIVGAVIECR